MKIKDLKVLIKAAEDLGLEDLDLVLDESRDGVTEYPKATANFVNVGDYKALAFSYE